MDRENGAFQRLIAEEACEDCGTNSHKPGLVREVEVLSSLRLSVDVTIVLLSDVLL